MPAVGGETAQALGEVAANAVMYGRSGHPGGSFTIAAGVLSGELG